ncbi:unnamed protein product [Pylaiella littoralis]
MVLCSTVPACVGKRATKDWSKMDLDDLAKQWEDGDDEEELKTEEQAKFEKLERRRKKAKASTGKLDPSTFGSMNAAQIGAMAAGQRDTAGPTMLFVQIESAGLGEADGGGGGGDEPISKEQTEAVSERFVHMAQIGSLDVDVYTLEAGSILVSSQRGWEGKEILNFLLSRPEVSKVTWNSQEFFPPKDGAEL